MWSDETDISILTKHLLEFGGSYASGRATEIVHGQYKNLEPPPPATGYSWFTCICEVPPGPPRSVGTSVTTRPKGGDEGR